MNAPYNFTDNRSGHFNSSDVPIYNSMVSTSPNGQVYLGFNNCMMYPQSYMPQPQLYAQMPSAAIQQPSHDVYRSQPVAQELPKTVRPKKVLDIFDPATKERFDIEHVIVPKVSEPPAKSHGHHFQKPIIVQDAKPAQDSTTVKPSQPEPKVNNIKETNYIPKEASICKPEPARGQVVMREDIITLEESNATEDLIEKVQTVEIENKAVQDSCKVNNNKEKNKEEVKIEAIEKDEKEEKIEAEEKIKIEDKVDNEDELNEDISDEQSEPLSETGEEESDIGQRVKRYSRDELMKLRKNIDTSMMSCSIPSNIMKGHVKQTNKRRTVFLKTDLKLDSVANPYVIKKAEDRTSLLHKELNIILNRLLEDNILEVIDDIKKLSLSGKEEMSCFVEVLTTKAIRQTKYSKVYAKFCVSLAAIKQFDGFKPCLLVAVNKLFETPLQTHIAQTNAQIDAKIAESNDVKVKKMLEEDRETAISKKRETFLGIMQFFSQLFVHKIIPDKSAQESLKPFIKPKTQDEILAILTCLNICGPALEERIPNILKDCIAGLENSKKDMNMEQHVLYKITALVELRARHWKKLEAVLPPTQILHRPEQRRETVARRIQTHSNQRKTGDSQKLINPKSLTLSGQTSGPQEKFLGPAFDWSKGSHSNSSTQRQNQSKISHLANSEVTSESESGKDSRPSSTSTKKQNTIAKKTSLKIDEKLTAKEAIRDAFDAFKVSDTPSFDLLLHEKEKLKFVQCILCKNIEKSHDTRKMTTDIIYYLYKTKQLSSEQIYQGFLELLKICDEDFLVDYPKVDDYIGEFLSAIAVDVSTVIKITSKLPDSRRCKCLATCLIFESTRPENDLAKIYSNAVIDWTKMNASSFKDFAKNNNIKLMEKELTESDKLNAAILGRNFDDIRSICESNPNKSNEYINQIVSSFPNGCRKDIDEFVPIIKKLAESEPTLLSALEKATEKEAFKQWLLSLMQHKLISRECIQTYSNSFLSKLSHKEAASQVLKKSCR